MVYLFCVLPGTIPGHMVMLKKNGNLVPLKALPGLGQCGLVIECQPRNREVDSRQGCGLHPQWGMQKAANQ